MTERGVIENRERARQLRDFSGLRYGNITPTDIDALIEYKDVAYVIIETKFSNAELPTGQRLAIERLCDDLQNFKHTIAIVSRHNFPVNEDIDLAKTVVDKYRWRGKWIEIKKITNEIWTVKRLVDWYLNTPEILHSVP